MGDSSPKDDRDLLEEFLRVPLFQEFILRGRISTLIEQARFHLRQLGLQDDDPSEFRRWLEETKETEESWSRALLLQDYLRRLREAQDALDEGNYRAAFVAVVSRLESPAKIGFKVRPGGGQKRKLSSRGEDEFKYLAAGYWSKHPKYSKNAVVDRLTETCKQVGFDVSKTTLFRALKSLKPPE